MKISELKKILSKLIGEELKEITGTGSVAGYATPFAFSKNPKSKGNTKVAQSAGYKLIKELIQNILKEMSSTGSADGYATPYAFSGGSEEDAKNKKKKDLEKSMPGIKVVDEDTVSDMGLVKEGRGRYYNFRDHPMKNHAKVSYSIMEINKMLKEIEYLAELNIRLKNESNVGPDMYWKRTAKHISNINERLKKISKKVEYLSR